MQWNSFPIGSSFVPRDSAQILANDKNVYLLGGRTWETSEYLNDVWTSTNVGRSWRKLPQSNTSSFSARSDFAACWSGGYAWVIGGATENVAGFRRGITATVFRSSDLITWTPANPLPINLAFMQCAATERALYTAGGCNQLSAGSDSCYYVADIYRAQVSGGSLTWSKINSLSSIAAFVTFLSAPQALLAVDGQTGVGWSWRYVIESSRDDGATFSTAPSPWRDVGMSYEGGFVLGDAVYVAGDNKGLLSMSTDSGVSFEACNQSGTIPTSLSYTTPMASSSTRVFVYMNMTVYRGQVVATQQAARHHTPPSYPRAQIPAPRPRV